MEVQLLQDLLGVPFWVFQTDNQWRKWAAMSLRCSSIQARAVSRASGVKSKPWSRARGRTLSATRCSPYRLLSHKGKSLFVALVDL